MAAVMDNEAFGQIGQFPIEQWYWEMPVCTRLWVTATAITSILVQCKVVTAFQLFYSFRAVWVKSQYWRLITTFTFFGPLSLDLLWHIYFLQRYSRLLESSSGVSSAQFSWLLLYTVGSLLTISTLFVSVPFLGSSLSSTLVYIWSRRNPETRLSFLFLLVFKAPYLPWVLMAFSLFMHGTIPKDEILGVVVGHVYYFFADVYPGLHGGQRPMDPPRWWIRLWEGQPRIREDTMQEEEDDADHTNAEGVDGSFVRAPAPGVGEVR